MKKWEMATLKYIHSCLIRLGHYKVRGTINYPPAHLTALIEEYRLEDLLIETWGKDVLRRSTRGHLIKAYCLLLRHTASLESYGANPEVFYARRDFESIRSQVILAIRYLEEDILSDGILLEKLDQIQVQNFP